ncbi:MAG: class I SAM-dependent methyltransferase [Acidobacteria bacterium]|nr:class I SAM-dependent methyltransferase [Acidobacteriota bacterium]
MNPHGATKGHPYFAAVYDVLMRVAERRLLAKLRAKLLGCLQGKVLEIGLGTGANLAYYPAAVQLIATEPDPFMLRRAEKKVRKMGRPKALLQLAAAERLPFVDRSFDHVVSTLVLCTVMDPNQALLEIRRVLKSDGRFHFIEHVRAEGWVGRMQDSIEPVWKRLAAGCTVNRQTGALIEAAGFQMESIEAEKIGIGVPLLLGTARLKRVGAR